MALFQLNSNNPQFSYIIKKNPLSGMQLRAIRKGMAYGWYSSEDTFNIHFKDGIDSVSYGDAEFEYLNTSRYNSSVFILNALSEFLNDNIKKIDPLDTDGFNNTIIIHAVHIHNIEYIKKFNKYFEDFNIEITHIASKTFKIKISTTKSLHMLLNFANLISVFIALLDRNEFINIDVNSISKYIESVIRSDAPFFIRYLFIRNFFRSKNMFNKYKARLEQTDRYSINFAYGDTASQRRNYIRKLLSFDNNIIDVGCGEGFYAIPFSMNNPNINYSAIDIDPTLTEQVMKTAEKKDIKNINIHNHINDFISTYDNSKSDVILTEVIEHMPQNESIELIKTILNNINFNKFIITTPNKDFNKFYMIADNEFRHHDHDWEPTKFEFTTFMDNILNEFSSLKYEFIDIGDSVDGISTSIGCIITKD